MLTCITPALGGAVDPAKLPGVTVDDTAAKLTGDWTPSTSVGTFVKDGYIHARGDNKAVRFTLTAPEAGRYHVRMSYTAGGNRDDRVPVHVETAAGKQTFHIDQKKQPADGVCFHELTVLELKAKEKVTVVVSTDGTSEYVIADAAQLLTEPQVAAALKAVKAAQPKPKPASTKEPPAPQPKAEPFKRERPSRSVNELTAEQLDALLTKAGAAPSSNVIGDAQFLRRVTFDLIGRQPTPEALQDFLKDTSPGKRAAVVDRLLKSEQFGVNWGNYFSDVIGYRQQEPQLTFHDYGPFRAWLAEQFNAGKGWDETTYRMLTAAGKVGDNPETTFVAFHQGNANRLAGETTRVFLGVQTACAECHDHPFVFELTQESFHGMAAFYARTDAKIAQLNSDNIDVKSKDKGEHRVPGTKEEIAPTLLFGESLTDGESDLARRTALARWIVSPDNPRFARAYVNRIWWYLTGSAFIEPVDDMPIGQDGELADVHQALADHLIASKFDTRALLRTIVLSRAYQQPMSGDATARRLRGDEMFDSLKTAIDLPNVTPPRQKKTGAVRFPPPPKSTRDLVDDAFGFDPSIDPANAPRTMKQAMFMMNNEQLQAQINAAPDSGTWLSKLLKQEMDDKAALIKLYEAVLARRPAEKELKLVLAHIEESSDRGEGFEDVLWALVNSAEFTTRP